MRNKRKGWGLLKRGRPLMEFCETKESLLAGYGIVSCNPLRVVEKNLRQSGRIPTRMVMVEAPEAKRGFFWSLLHHGRFCNPAWECIEATKRQALITGCIFERLRFCVTTSTGRRSEKLTKRAQAKSFARLAERGYRAIKVVLVPEEKSPAGCRCHTQQEMFVANG